MKTHDACALRDFDATKILQRPYFRAWHNKYQGNCDLSDTEILAKFTTTDADEIAVVEEKNRILKEISDRLSDLYDMIQKRHADYRRGRLETYRRRLIQRKIDDATKFQRNIEREQNLLGFYTATVLPKLAELNAHAAVLLGYSEQILHADCRKRFGERLKKTREFAGFTRKQVASELRLTVTGYSYYERGERELTTLTITRLAKLLHVSTDSLFGLE